MLFAAFSFYEQFFSSSTVVSVAKGNVLQTSTIAVFETGPEADPNFAPFRWRIWLAPSEFLCLLANQNATFVTLFCTQLPFFCTVLPKNCISLSQSQSRNFFMYIINALKRAFSFLSLFIRIHTYEKQKHKVNYCRVIWVIRFYETSIKSLIIFCNITECEGGLSHHYDFHWHDLCMHYGLIEAAEHWHHVHLKRLIGHLYRHLDQPPLFSRLPYQPPQKTSKQRSQNGQSIRSHFFLDMETWIIIASDL